MKRFSLVALYAELSGLLAQHRHYTSNRTLRACSRSSELVEGGHPSGYMQMGGVAIVMEDEAEEAVSERCEPGAV